MSLIAFIGFINVELPRELRPWGSNVINHNDL